jgi:methylenetetrahydrofolate--tRNA-(uracil-5-)-methyltransferase
MNTGSSARVIGGGLAGCEAAWQMAERGLAVTLHEMRPTRRTEAHLTDQLAELVCSNSLRSDDAQNNAVGLLHEEMRRAGSLILRPPDAHKVPAGGALAVDREGFAGAVESALAGHDNISVSREEVLELPDADAGPVVVASGPLTSPALGASIVARTSEAALAFFDAIAPVIHKDSIDFDIAWMQSRYDKEGPGDDAAAYINCPLDAAQYEAFIDALVTAECMEFKQWEKDTPYFEGCLPVEVMAERGRETLRHGPLKPVGLTNPRAPEIKSHAVVQLRQDNALGTLYNMVGFQTKMKHGEQKRILRTIPGLANARFARLGGMHRNTFLNSPQILGPTLCLETQPNIRFAGQITGVEGYVESAAIGLLAGRFIAEEQAGGAARPPPPATALGALLRYITGGHLAGGAGFQPMNVNFGLFPPLAGKTPKRERKPAMARRALADLAAWLSPEQSRAAE